MKLSRAFGIVALGMVTFAAGPAGAQTTAVGPYYATPSWDQTLPSATRFIVLSNFNSAAVLDRETGLVWQRSTLGTQVTFRDASTACLGSQVGNRGGWRLPTINELASVLDPSATAGPALPPGNPFVGFDPTRSEMWSATIRTPPHDASPSPDAYMYAGWFTHPSAGFIVRLGGLSGAIFGSALEVWCVRGGVQAAPQ